MSMVWPTLGSRMAKQQNIGSLMSGTLTHWVGAALASDVEAMN